MSAKTRTILILLAATALAGCGLRTNLTPEKGNALPMKPLTASAVPTPEQLMTPETQARPKRSDEQLRRSEERRADPFDLPPT
jgi:hypothetical protein